MGNGRIIEARVQSVSNGVAEIVSEYTGQVIPDVRVAVNGEGPQKGDLVLAASTDDGGGDWHILTRAREVPHSGTTPDPETAVIGSGDHGYALPNGARMVLRKDGRLEIVSHGGSAIYMLPLDSLIHLNMKKLRAVGTHGTLLFEPCVFGVQLSRALGDPADIAIILGNAGDNFGVGTWAASRPTDFRLSTGDSFLLEVASDGGISVKAKDLGLLVEQMSNLDLQGPLEAKTKNVNIDGGPSPYTVKAGTLDVTLQVSLKLSAPIINLDSDMVLLGKGADGPAIDGLKFLEWLVTDVLPAGGRITPPAIINFIVKALNFKVWL